MSTNKTLQPHWRYCSIEGDIVLERASSYLVEPQNIGPVFFPESRLSTRIRFHQAWYRAGILGIERFGCMPAANGQVPKGSVLPPAAALEGKNFTSAEAFDWYTNRRAQGWGVDPIRCTAVMTSSQALTFNAFAPLRHCDRWFRVVLSNIFDIDVKKIHRCEIEFAPSRPSLALGDKTRLDLWLLIATSSGSLSACIEVKYADRFSSRFLPVWKNDRYRDLTLRGNCNSWDLDSPQIRSRRINQLVRCHALTSFLGTSYECKNSARVAVIHHPDDAIALDIVDEYRSVVRQQSSIKSMDIKRLFEVMMDNSSSEEQRREVSTLACRYVQFDLSDPSWRLAQNTHSGRSITGSRQAD
ncbi:PGN_0703 family putative restriction endonuclease [Nocardia asiatica]|uniref:PGN_0703 family putative restriction endonuclease n=1 Tax=Nocardia asiatica TaxID=209252 RepID=UPI0012FC0F9A|nr:hypothetical protein [Nocardia asiatica]